MNHKTSVVHKAVDEIGSLIYGGTRSRFLLGNRLSDAILDQILSVMREIPEMYRRELVWHLILQGHDSRILSTAGRRSAVRYRKLTGMYASEVRRPEDTPMYPYRMGFRPPPQVSKVLKGGDPIRSAIRSDFHDLGTEVDVGDGRGPTHIGGQDDLVVTEQVGYVMMMDGWIWQVDWNKRSAKRLVQPPRMPAGGAVRPGGSKVLFCATRWSESTPRAANLGGVYELDPETPSVRPVVLRIPWREGVEWGEGSWQPGPVADEVRVYTPEEIRQRELSFEEVEAVDSSRPICYANDLDITDDGRYVYFTEPSPYGSMGLGSWADGLRLTRNGRLWRIDLQEERIGLAAEGFAFLDGVVVTPRGVIVTELSRFRMVLLDFARGSGDTLLADLPGMPDGLARFEGKVWQALLHERTWLVTLVHRYPNFFKPLYALLPARRRKPPKGCGFLVLDEETLAPVCWVKHDGSTLHHIAAISPSKQGIFLLSFDPGTRGLHWIADPTR